MNDWSSTMSGDLENKREQINHLAKELNDGGLSRRGLFDRLKGLGVGFGAAFMLGMRQSEANTAANAATATLKSTNPALNDIIEEGKQTRPSGEGAAHEEDRPIQVTFRRFFRRYFRRVYVR